MRWVEHAGTTENATSDSACARGDRVQFVHTGVLRDLDHTIERVASVPRYTLLVDEYVCEADTAMPSGLLERDLAALEQLDHGRSAHTEQLGGFLGRQPLMHGRDRDGLAGRHCFDDVAKHFEHLGRQHELFTVGSKQRCRFRSGLTQRGDERVERLDRR